jgi:hypothetical protein
MRAFITPASGLIGTGTSPDPDEGRGRSEMSISHTSVRNDPSGIGASVCFGQKASCHWASQFVFYIK